MSSDLPKRYSCKVQMGAWLFVDVGLSLCLYTYFLISAWIYESVLIWVMLLVMLALHIFRYSMFMKMSYELDDTHLIIRSGLMRHRMLLTEIFEIVPSAKPQKLLMTYSKFRQKMDIPSPQERDAFLDDFGNRPGFKREGDRVIRKESHSASTAVSQ